jgi:hypothetical protein
VALSLAVAAVVTAVIVVLARMGVEWHWFGQFDLESVLLRRWMLQCLAFVLVFGGGCLLQLKQLQRCWRLRQQAGQKALGPDPLFRLRGWGLLLAVLALLLLLAAGLAYLVLQARDLIAAPFSGHGITGLSVLFQLTRHRASQQVVSSLRLSLSPSPSLPPFLSPSLSLSLALSLSLSLSLFTNSW